MPTDRLIPSVAQRALAAGSDLFADLKTDEIDRVLDRATPRRFDAKDVLFLEGEELSGLFLVVGGQVKLTKLNASGREVIVAVAGPGEPLAAVAALPGPKSFPVAAHAITACHALFWSRPLAREVVEGLPRLHRNLLQTTSGRTRELLESLRDVATEKVPSRLASALLRLARREGRRTAEGVELPFPLTRQELAEMIGATLFTVSRQLSEWGQHDWVAKGGSGMILRDPEALADLAGIDWATWSDEA